MQICLFLKVCIICVTTETIWLIRQTPISLLLRIFFNDTCALRMLLLCAGRGYVCIASRVQPLEYSRRQRIPHENDIYILGTPKPTHSCSANVFAYMRDVCELYIVCCNCILTIDAVAKVGFSNIKWCFC